MSHQDYDGYGRRVVNQDEASEFPKPSKVGVVLISLGCRGSSLAALCGRLRKRSDYQA